MYGGWLYLSFIVNLSVCYAFYCLGMFYYVLKTPLKPFDPVPKFLCIKAVLFLSFWQVRPGNFSCASLTQRRGSSFRIHVAHETAPCHMCRALVDPLS